MATTTAENKTNFTFSIDKSTKQQFDDLCDQIGISMSAALTAFVKQAIRQKGMSFSVLDENGFTYEEAKVLKERIKDMRNGDMVYHDLIVENRK